MTVSPLSLLRARKKARRRSNTSRKKFYTPRWASRWQKDIEQRGAPIRVALDVSGGDKGMGINIEAALSVVEQSKWLHVILVGRKDEIEACLLDKQFPAEQISVLNADNIVTMHDRPLVAAKDDSNSISQGLELVHNGEADAFVSIGNTGAVTAGAYMRLGILPEIERPPILGVFPTMGGNRVVVLDIGANIDCKARHLLKFAVLGSVYAEKILERTNPKIALLSIGEEPGKGNSVTKETHQLLSENAKTLGLNFIGNIEGRDILTGVVDVIVCDGFIGNILLKYTESLYGFVKRLFKKGRRFSILSLLGGLLLYPSLKRTLKDFNYAEYGGAPLLGVKGNVVIGHGSSTAKAIANAILLAQTMAVANMPQALLRATEKLRELKDEDKDSGNGLIRSFQGAYE